jgi:hypothetical protein
MRFPKAPNMQSVYRPTHKNEKYGEYGDKKYLHYNFLQYFLQSCLPPHQMRNGQEKLNDCEPNKSPKMPLNIRRNVNMSGGPIKVVV